MAVTEYQNSTSGKPNLAILAKINGLSFKLKEF